MGSQETGDQVSEAQNAGHYEGDHEKPASRPGERLVPGGKNLDAFLGCIARKPRFDAHIALVAPKPSAADLDTRVKLRFFGLHVPERIGLRAVLRPEGSLMFISTGRSINSTRAANGIAESSRIRSSVSRRASGTWVLYLPVAASLP
jgi:hypothetical protein